MVVVAMEPLGVTPELMVDIQPVSLYHSSLHQSVASMAMKSSLSQPLMVMVLTPSSTALPTPPQDLNKCPKIT